MPSPQHSGLIALGLAITVTTATPALAGRFMTLVEAETFAPGEGEIIQAGSLTRAQEEQSRTEAGRWQLGVEFGLVPNVQIGMALPAWNITRHDEGSDHRFDGTAMWGVWNLAPPRPGGLGVSTAVTVGECAEKVNGEVGVVVETSHGPLTIVTNVAVLHYRPHDSPTGPTNHFMGRLGISRTIGHGLAVALEGEWQADNFGSLNYRSEAFNWGPAILWEGRRAWVLGGALLDPDPLTTQRGAALQVQAGIPF